MPVTAWETHCHSLFKFHKCCSAWKQEPSLISIISVTVDCPTPVDISNVSTVRKWIVAVQTTTLLTESLHCSHHCTDLIISIVCKLHAATTSVINTNFKVPYVIVCIGQCQRIWRVDIYKITDPIRNKSYNDDILSKYIRENWMNTI